MFPLLFLPVNPDEPHTDGHRDDKAENTKQEEEQDPLGGLHLEQDDEVLVEALAQAGLVASTRRRCAMIRAGARWPSTNQSTIG